ncbi:hypothetical protein HCH_05587 [Hahella chejuensis KCTC 2396]|uniref:Uncharacterized protein n=1 Tax=Hahella chejuensis (strain KCTC 2396) TaxID=349521 RepID=Q2SAS9_HAHCH|nr:hypothetical protein HCH_05587 [Hahella chejuensis KCTC 2396]
MITSSTRLPPKSTPLTERVNQAPGNNGNSTGVAFPSAPWRRRLCSGKLSAAGFDDCLHHHFRRKVLRHRVGIGHRQLIRSFHRRKHHRRQLTDVFRRQTIACNIPQQLRQLFHLHSDGFAIELSDIIHPHCFRADQHPGFHRLWISAFTQRQSGVDKCAQLLLRRLRIDAKHAVSGFANADDILDQRQQNFPFGFEVIMNQSRRKPCFRRDCLNRRALIALFRHHTQQRIDYLHTALFCIGLSTHCLPHLIRQSFILVI